MTPKDAAFLGLVFGAGKGTDTATRAKSSAKRFVRSIDQLAEDTPQAQGPKLSAYQAWEAYGLEVLSEVAREGSARL